MYHPTSILAASSNSMKIVEYSWERVQLILTLSGPLYDVRDLHFYLYHPISERKISIKHIEHTKDLIRLRINMTIAWDEQSPIPSGRWVLAVVSVKSGEVSYVIPDPALIDNGATNRDKNMDHFKKVFRISKSKYYSVRPIADDDSGLMYLAIFFKGEKSKKTRREIRREQRRKRRNACLLKIRTKVFQLIFTCSQKILGIKEDRMLFTSDSRGEIGGNMEFIYNRLVERGLDEQYEIKMMFKANIHHRRSPLDKFKLPYYLATSKTILVDDFHPLLYKLDLSEKQNIIQLWHASGPFKTVGYSRVGKPGGPPIDGLSHKMYTSAIVGGDHAIPYYAEAFGMYEEDLYPTGIPRMDPFFDDENKEQIREKIYKEFPKAKEADKVILFAPTFRGSGPKTAHYPMYHIDFPTLAKYARENNAVIIFKLHPFVRNNISIPKEYSDVFIDAFDSREINDILLISDLLITDYSSVVFEYSLLDKPMIFFAFDLHRYVSSRDFYEEFEDFVPGKIVHSFNDLMKVMNDEDYEMEKVEKFRDKYFKYQDSHSSDRVIDWLILDNFPEEISRGSRQKKLHNTL